MRTQAHKPPEWTGKIAGLPSRWIASRGGVRAYVADARERHPRTGEPCYRLRFRDGVSGDLWTRERLDAAGVRWLLRRPIGFPLQPEERGALCG